MNPVIMIHLPAAILVIALAIPLIRRKVKMNRWYGVRIPAAFASEAAWFDLNHYGGRLLLAWGLAMLAAAGIGAFLGRKYWLAYNWASLVLVIGGLAWVVTQIYRYAEERKQNEKETPDKLP